MKAHEHGVPQKRERLFIVGSRDSNFNFEFPEPKNTSPDLRDIVGFDMEGTLKVPEELIKEAGVNEESIMFGEGTSIGKVHPYLALHEKARGVRGKTNESVSINSHLENESRPYTVKS